MNSAVSDRVIPDRVIIVTGGNPLYFPMITELLASIRDAAPAAPPMLGVVDAGLTVEQGEHLRAAGVLVARPPLQPAFPEAALRARPALAANFAKLWLDQLFPGHDVIVWLDGDTGVQDYAAGALLIGAARRGAHGWGGDYLPREPWLGKTHRRPLASGRVSGPRANTFVQFQERTPCRIAAGGAEGSGDAAFAARRRLRSAR